MANEDCGLIYENLRKKYPPTEKVCSSQRWRGSRLLLFFSSLAVRF